jgi:hypothetical protein
MNKESPFTKWWEENIQSQMAVSDEIRVLMARAFEGGQKAPILRSLNNEEIHELVKATFAEERAKKENRIFDYSVTFARRLKEFYENK